MAREAAEYGERKKFASEVATIKILNTPLRVMWYHDPDVTKDMRVAVGYRDAKTSNEGAHAFREYLVSNSDF